MMVGIGVVLFFVFLFVFLNIFKVRRESSVKGYRFVFIEVLVYLRCFLVIREKVNLIVFFE